MREMSEAFHQSGLLPTWIKNPLAALAIIAKGQELGLSAMYSLSNIQMIEGKPTANAEAMAALIYRDHGSGALTFLETNSERCVIEYRRKGGRPGQLTFSVNDARRAGLLDKQNWKRYPDAMLRARCISAVARLAFPDSVGGLYTPEELDADETSVSYAEQPAPHADDSLGDEYLNLTAQLKEAEADEADGPRISVRRARRIESLRRGLDKAQALGMTPNEFSDDDIAALSDEQLMEALSALNQQIRDVEAAIREANTPAEEADGSTDDAF